MLSDIKLFVIVLPIIHCKTKHVLLRLPFKKIKPKVVRKMFQFGKCILIEKGFELICPWKFCVQNTNEINFYLINVKLPKNFICLLWHKLVCVFWLWPNNIFYPKCNSHFTRFFNCQMRSETKWAVRISHPETHLNFFCGCSESTLFKIRGFYSEGVRI